MKIEIGSRDGIERAGVTALGWWQSPFRGHDMSLLGADFVDSKVKALGREPAFKVPF